MGKIKISTVIVLTVIFLIFDINQAKANKIGHKKPSDSSSEYAQSLINYNPVINPSQATVMIQKNKNNPFFAVLDIRDFKDFINGHITGAVNISYKLKNFEQIINDLDKDMIYVVYCEDGTQSKKTLDMMLKSGFKKVYIISGGYKEWIHEGYSVIRQDFCCGEQK